MGNKVPRNPGLDPRTFSIWWCPPAFRLLILIKSDLNEFGLWASLLRRVFFDKTASLIVKVTAFLIMGLFSVTFLEHLSWLQIDQIVHHYNFRIRGILPKTVVTSWLAGVSPSQLWDESSGNIAKNFSFQQLSVHLGLVPANINLPWIFLQYSLENSSIWNLER